MRRNNNREDVSHSLPQKPRQESNILLRKQIVLGFFSPIPASLMKETERAKENYYRSRVAWRRMKSKFLLSFFLLRKERRKKKKSGKLFCFYFVALRSKLKICFFIFCFLFLLISLLHDMNGRTTFFITSQTLEQGGLKESLNFYS